LQKLVNIVAGLGAIVGTATALVWAFVGHSVVDNAMGFVGYVPTQAISKLQTELDQKKVALEDSQRALEKQRLDRSRGDALVWTAKGVGLVSTAEQCVFDAQEVLSEQGYDQVERGDPESRLPFYVFAQFWENESPAKVLVDCYGDKFGMLFPSVSIAVKAGEKSTGKERVTKIRDALVARRRVLTPEEVTIKQ
jgi:hypothetical protein